MKTQKKAEVISAREFDYDQLVKISNDNYDVLNQCIDPEKINKDDNFICIPLMEHGHAFGEPVEPHLRVTIVCVANNNVLGFQEMTFAQYRQGEKIELITHKMIKNEK